MAYRQGYLDPTKLSSFADKKTKEVNVVIETPKGSRNKFAWDKEVGCFSLSKVLPAGMEFPYSFGFVPSTTCEDGDGLDVLVFMDEPVFSGCVVKSRLLGVIEGEQTEDGKTERNDRLIAVASEAHENSEVKSINDLNPKLLKELEQFFKNYHATEKVTFKPIGRGGVAEALKLVKKYRK